MEAMELKVPGDQGRWDPQHRVPERRVQHAERAQRLQKVTCKCSVEDLPVQICGGRGPAVGKRAIGMVERVEPGACTGLRTAYVPPARLDDLRSLGEPAEGSGFNHEK